MLAKPFRLRQKRDFDRIFKYGRRLEGNLLRLNWLGISEKKIRFGFLVSTRVAKKATQRNFYKRRLRAAAQQLLPKAKPGFDIVISLKKIPRQSPPPQSLTQELKELMSKANIL